MKMSYFSMMSFVLLLLGCGNRPEYAKMVQARSQLPLCFVKSQPDVFPWDIGKDPNVIPASEILLLPLVVSGHKLELRVVHPLVYRPGDPVVFAGYVPAEDGKLYDTIVVCPGYLAGHVGYESGFFSVGQFREFECGMVELCAARNEQESQAVLRAFAWLLEQDSVRIGPFRTPDQSEPWWTFWPIVEKLSPDEWRTYATTTALQSETFRPDDPIPASFTVWNVAPGTVVHIRLSEEERVRVRAFFARHRVLDNQQP